VIEYHELVKDDLYYELSESSINVNGTFKAITRFRQMGQSLFENNKYEYL